MIEPEYDLLEDLPAGTTSAVSTRGIRIVHLIDGKWRKVPHGEVVPLDAYGPWIATEKEAATNAQ